MRLLSSTSCVLRGCCDNHFSRVRLWEASYIFKQTHHPEIPAWWFIWLQSIFSKSYHLGLTVGFQVQFLTVPPPKWSFYVVLSRCFYVMMARQPFASSLSKLGGNWAGVLARAVSQACSSSLAVALPMHILGCSFLHLPSLSTPAALRLLTCTGTSHLLGTKLASPFPSVSITYLFAVHLI